MAADLVQNVQHLEFHLYPAHLLLGVVDAPGDAEATLEDLLAGGVARADLRTSFGSSGLAAIDPDGQMHGWIARLWRGAQRATGEHQTFAHYAEEVGRGHICVGVQCHSPREESIASAILDRHGAHFVNYFGAAMIETLRR